MLELRVSGDTHPKTFTLVTDDHEGELARLQEIIHDEIGAEPDDPMRQWLDARSADEFKAGVVVPAEWVGEFADVLEPDWPQAADEVAQQQRDAMDQIERQAESG